MFSILADVLWDAPQQIFLIYFVFKSPSLYISLASQEYSESCYNNRRLVESVDPLPFYFPVISIKLLSINFFGSIWVSIVLISCRSNLEIHSQDTVFGSIDFVMLLIYGYQWWFSLMGVLVYFS